MKIALTGATGLIGSRFYDLLKSRYEIIPVSSSYGVDITDKNNLNKFLKSKNPGLIVHLAAKTNVDGCEVDKVEDISKLKKAKVYDGVNLDVEALKVEEWKGSVSAFGVNVVGTKNLADYSLSQDIKIIYISTDFVFDGKKDEGYSEEDVPNPIDWYGQTKFWGEKVITGKNLITRIAYPYGYKSSLKKDLIWTLVSLISEQESVKLVSDQIITPTFIDDIVNGLDYLIEKDVVGLVNLVGNNFLSPYEIGVAIAREFNLRESKLSLTTREELYKNRAERPFKMIIKNDKLRTLGFEMTDFFDSLSKIKQPL